VTRLAPSVVLMTSAVLSESVTPSRVLEAPPSRLVSRALALRFVSIVGSAIGFYLPLSVVPMLAQESGSSRSAGLATVALLLATVACELMTPRLVGRMGYRWALAIGLTLLGAPTVVLTVAHNAWAIIAVSMVRGAGFAISVVAGGAVTALLIPAHRRGEGLALVGLVGGVPGMLALPAGVWAAGRWGYAPVFVVTTVAPLLALLSVPGLPRRAATLRDDADQHGVLHGLRNPALTRPAAIFAASTAAVGVLVTFLPLATADGPAWVAAAALLAQPAASTVARWFAGRVGDRRGQLGLLAPGLLLCAAGMAALVAIGTPGAVMGGALVFGAGFGVLQNATLALMYTRAPAGAEGAVSAIWNAAYDLGMAAGALAAGLVVTSVGYSMTFALAAALMLPALRLVHRDRASR
jgi:predicted MFS family arabinose efflux permease